MKKISSFSKELSDSVVQCQVCKHFCILKPGESGNCSVRKNIDGDLTLMVYGKALGTHIDPVEKKPLYHFYPGSKFFSFGTLGCNLSCDFCQNWQMAQPNNEFKDKIGDIGENWSPSRILKYVEKNNLDGVAYTYNEPTVFWEYALDTMKLIKNNGYKNIWVSNGFMSEQLIETMDGLLDAINIDLKSFSGEFYEKICGGRLQEVLENIKFIADSNIHLELTTLIIPGENDTKADIQKIAEFISSLSPNIPWHISAFHPAYKMKNHSSTSLDKLKQAYDIGKNKGLKYVYIGNLKSKYTNTYCPECGEVCVQRTGLGLMSNSIKNGKCSNCGKDIDGIWS